VHGIFAVKKLGRESEDVCIVRPTCLGFKVTFHSPWNKLQRLGKQIVQQTQENGRVIASELAKIKVAQCTQQYLSRHRQVGQSCVEYAQAGGALHYPGE
jgi:hypothetical protein